MTPLIPISFLLYVSFVLTIYLGINVSEITFSYKIYQTQKWAFKIQLMCKIAKALNFQLILDTRISKEDKGKDSVSLWLDHLLKDQDIKL